MLSNLSGPVSPLYNQFLRDFTIILFFIAFEFGIKLHGF